MKATKQTEKQNTHKSSDATSLNSLSSLSLSSQLSSMPCESPAPAIEDPDKQDCVFLGSPYGIVHEKY